ncbi:MAG: peptidoglycan DD-metalloendopeptidase family protein [Luteitalea sp.]|nr:peptidoglycan DD-metalloendopeptidase family protein [Luteitalea sp.]
MKGFRFLVAAALAALILAGGVRQGVTADTAPLEVAIEARALQPGELLVVTITAPEGAAEVGVRLFNRAAQAFMIGKSRWQALVGIDLDQRPGSYTLTVDARVNGTLITRTRPVRVRSKAFPSRTLRVAPEFVNPPPALLERINRESALVGAAYAASARERLWTEPFARPVPQPANSRFGTRSVFNGERRAPHAGTDFLSGAGTPVGAPNAGRVVVARDLFFSGNTVIIDHGLGVFSMLAHLSRIDVHEGDVIAVGRVVGLVGATGRVTGPHLHWALRVNGARVDALSALQLLGSKSG